MPDRYEEICSRFRWEIPERFNIARDCCGRWAAERSRLALLWEDESGATARLTFDDLQKAANRLSNALQGLGVRRGDRVALLLPQRPETAIAYIAIFQMGAIALPLSHLFGPEALEYRLEHAGACAAIVEPTTLPNLWAIKDKLSQLKHVIGVGGAREKNVLDFDAVLEKSSSSFKCVDTRADDPSLIIYTSGTTGAPKGALHAQRVILGNIPGFVHSHDFFPQPGDVFWSPA
ncbi:MAG TPA: AMP-binding protein, partial [Burkholderiales bacterium]|nr:AMP-binding protein [Burkholderiales bacterium]